MPILLDVKTVGTVSLEFWLVTSRGLRFETNGCIASRNTSIGNRKSGNEQREDGIDGSVARGKHRGHVPGVSYEMMGRESAWAGDSFANRSTKRIDLAERACASG